MTQHHVEIVREAHERFAKTGDPISLFRIRAVGAGSAAAVERGDGIVWAFRAGKLARLDHFNDQDAALEAVGLRESPT